MRNPGRTKGANLPVPAYAGSRGPSAWRMAEDLNQFPKESPGVTNKTALITGITGQDGAYLARLLLDKGYLLIATEI